LGENSRNSGKKNYYIIDAIFYDQGIRERFCIFFDQNKIIYHITIFSKYKEQASVAKLQIGTGANILDGWFNTDIVPDKKRKIHFLDLAWCFPFPEESFEYIFSEHSLEHLSFNEGLFMLRECWRVLKHNGKIRIATPDLNKLIEYYANESKLHSDYSEFEYEHFIKHKIARDILTKDIVLNNFFRDWGHKFIYDNQTITCALQDAGFVNIKTYGIGVSDDAAFVGLEQHGNIISDEFNEMETMIVEAVKP
jgi:predicted SAM-dependent methyltransferase